MSSRFSEIVVDCVEPVALARWWAETLGWEAADGSEPGERMLRAPDDDDGTIPALLFLSVEEAKPGKNRIHLDLASESLEEQAAIVGRLVARGATRVDIGQTGVPWIVLADPEGNEFCVLSSKP